ncbi:MAG: hypothetical protein CSB24_01030 [Deltaproteobacteria bacterium]|nr:MAG: hypothetical protein CSB24_01030 [Deltaproteobacteria bacterium]
MKRISLPFFLPIFLFLLVGGCSVVPKKGDYSKLFNLWQKERKEPPEVSFNLEYEDLSLDRNYRFQLDLVDKETVAGKQWSLADCIDAALQKNPGLRSLDFEISQRRQQLYAALGEFLPDLSVSYNHNSVHSDDYKQGDGSGRSYEGDNLVLSLVQPVFDGFSGINGLRLAAFEEEKAVNMREAQRRRLIASIRSSYFEKLAAEAIRKNYEISLTRLLEQLEAAEAWVAQKLAPPLRVLEVKTRIAQTRHQLISARSRESSALARLRSALMLPPDTKMELTGRLSTPLMPLCSGFDECSQMSRRRPELVMSALAVDIAKQNANIIISRSLPSARISASWNQGKNEYDDPVPSGTNMSYTESEEESWSVIFSVTFTPFQGGRNFFNWRSYNKQVQSLVLQMEQTFQDIQSEVELRLLQCEEARAALAPALEAVREARLAWQMNLKFVKLGTVPLDDLLDAEIELTNARSTLISALLSLRLAEVNLALAAGDDRPPDSDPGREGADETAREVETELERADRPEPPS